MGDLYLKLRISGTTPRCSAGYANYPLAKASGFSKVFRHIKTIQEDIGEFQPKEKYDVIIATMTLHFLSAEKVPTTIKRMQEATKTGGLNVIAVYTEENPMGLRPHLFKKDELRNFYNNWEMLQYKEFLGPKIENRKDGGPERRYNAQMIARKNF